MRKYSKYTPKLYFTTEGEIQMKTL